MPKSGEGFIDFIGQVHKTKEQFGQDGPITVHCSAGVGRTGKFHFCVEIWIEIQSVSLISIQFTIFLYIFYSHTGVFISLSIVLERMQYEGVLDVFQTVRILRSQRPAMVQTEVRFISY